jgi:hypothetical protein
MNIRIMSAQPKRHQPQMLLENPVRMLFGRRCGHVVSALVACALAAPAAVGDVVLQRVGDAEIAAETLRRVGPVIVFESGLTRPASCPWLNSASSRVRPSSCILLRIDQTWLGRSGSFAPISLPLFHGGRRGGVPEVVA